MVHMIERPLEEYESLFTDMIALYDGFVAKEQKLGLDDEPFTKDVSKIFSKYKKGLDNLYKKEAIHFKLDELRRKRIEELSIEQLMFYILYCSHVYDNKENLHYGENDYFAKIEFDKDTKVELTFSESTFNKLKQSITEKE